ncbi:MAG: S1/P1 nuclease [Pyrinomonadaceae bacterium]
MRKLVSILILTVTLVLPQTAFAWNATGHQLVASIAWDNLSDTAKGNTIALLMKAPSGACFPRLSTGNSSSLSARERLLFMKTATWPDIVRPRGQDDTRPCKKFHRRDWHFVDFFWSGFSGDTTNPPQNLDRPIADINAVERLMLFRPFVVSNNADADRAINLAWILHLVGDIHQPLHASGRVTSTELDGDQGGNLFLLNNGNKLHGYWDNIVDNANRRKNTETFDAYLIRLTAELQTKYPKSHFGNLEATQFEKWARESVKLAQDNAYPRSLKRGQSPSPTYQGNTLDVSEEAIAQAGYRMADLLEGLFGH